MELTENLVLSRRTQVVLSYSGNGLSVRARGERQANHLNATAAYIWQHCDAQNTVANLVEIVQSTGRATSANVHTEISKTIGRLFSVGLVDTSVKPINPLIRLAFRGFRTEFNEVDNFFVELFSQWIDLLIVAPDDGADIEIVSNKTALVTNSTSAFRILFDESDQALDDDGFELVFCTQNRDPEDKVRRIFVPPDFQSNPSAPIDPKDDAYLRKLLSAPDNAPMQALATPEKKLTIGMATYDDYDGVYFTIQAIRLFHPEVIDEIEILVIDNNPGGVCTQALKDLGNWIGNYRYVPNNTIRGTAVRDFVFTEAVTEYVMCIDSHVLIAPGALRKLIDYFEAHPDTRDFLQGPLVYDDLKTISTHFEPLWRQGMFGVWATDDRGKDPASDPFEIPMQGLGLSACRREAWLGYNPRFHGFGGEEGYIHQKFHNAGARTLCLPFLRWSHRFERPGGTPYPNTWEHRIRNYLIGFEETGMDTSEVSVHFRDYLGSDVVDKVVAELERESDDPFSYFDAIYCINLDNREDRWQAARQEFERLGIVHRVQRFSAIETPRSHHIGCALSHRALIQRVKQSNLNYVLVFEDDAVFSSSARSDLAQNVDELATRQWKLFYLGGHKWGQDLPEAPGCKHLQVATGVTCTHALAYNRAVFDQILDEVPDNEQDMVDWLKPHGGIDQYYRQIDQRFICSPRVASQPYLLALEQDPGRFVSTREPDKLTTPADARPDRSSNAGGLKLSVVIPHCNEFHNLFMTIENLVIHINRDPDLTGRIEVIVVDNCSDNIVVEPLDNRDNRHEKVELLHHKNVTEFLPQQWLVKSGLLRVIEYNDDQSLWKTRQAGIDAARGEYVAFSDAHVLHEPGLFGFAVEVLDRFPDIGQLHGATCAFFSDPGTMCYQYQPRLEDNFWGDWTLDAPNYVDPVTPFKIPMASQATVFYRKRDLDQWGRAPREIGIYGGDETFMAMQTWMMDKQVWCDPRMKYHHLSHRRGYVFNNRDFTKNTFLVAYLLGGEPWLDKMYNSFRSNYSPDFYSELDWARDLSLSCADEHEGIMNKAKFSLDEVIATKPWTITPTCAPIDAER